MSGSAEKKRKRSQEDPEDEIEIDVNLPEPPSKKAKRKEKKAEKQKTKQPTEAPATVKDGATPIENTDQIKAEPAPTNQRSDYGIWIGNLNFSVTKEDLREFLSGIGDIADDEITRVHLPPPKNSGARKEDKNRGFAYIDFTTPEVLSKALTLTEKALFGRNVLIKNAKNFEGRPQKPSTDAAKTISTKEPSKRVFIGNLSFDVTRDEISEHFGQAGEVEDVFLATFEDSGKCKGFGWVRFAELEAAEAAVRGFVLKARQVEGDEDGEPLANGEEVKSKREKLRKWFINRLQGRELRCEFAEDSNTRYQKRFGKKPKPFESNDNAGFSMNAPPATSESGNRIKKEHHSHPAPSKHDCKASLNQDERREERRKRHEKMDARKIAPGQASSSAPRASAAIVAGAGRKISFD